MDLLIRHLGARDADAVLKQFDVDLRYFHGPGPAGGKEPAPADGSFIDHWGVERKWQTVTGRRKDGTPYTWRYKHLLTSSLAEAESIGDIENHAWPDPGRWDFAGVADACRAIRDAGCAVVFGGERLDRTAQLKAAMYLRGTERFMVDLLVEPALAECILEHIAEYYLQYNRRVFEAAAGNIDIFFMGDDMGTQNSSWVSLDTYRRFFKERFTRFIDQAHSFGILTMYHTCGRVTDLVGQFVDAGLDILQSLQPAAMARDFRRLKRQFGRDICFQGGIDIQQVLPFGSASDVRRHVRETAEALAPGGGYIFGTAHNILPDTPLENILALIAAYHDFGHCG